MSNLLLNERPKFGWRDLLIDEPPLLLRKSLAMRVGVNEAIVIQQLHFVLTHYDSRAVEIDGRRWCRAPLSFWCEQFPFFSETTIKRAFASLRESHLVLTERGREANVYTIDYAEVDKIAGQIDPSRGPDGPGVTDQDGPSSSIGEELKTEGEDVAATSAASGEAPALPGLEPPPVPPAPDKQTVTADVEAVFAHYVMVFGDRMKVKELTDPRIRDIKKALKAVGDDPAVCKRAIDGLKSYRDTHPDGSQDVGLSVIFATGPQDRSNLTEKIEWWAGQADDKADIPSSVPSAHRGRVLDLAVTVLKRELQPDSEAVAERAIQAEAALATRFHLKVISDGSGKLLRWEAVA